MMGELTLCEYPLSTCGYPTFDDLRRDPHTILVCAQAGIPDDEAPCDHDSPQAIAFSLRRLHDC
jgi:hypothetical protein